MRFSRGMRKKPPHALELAAIKQKKDKVIQNVFLPSGASIVSTSFYHLKYFLYKNYKS